MSLYFKSTTRRRRGTSLRETRVLNFFAEVLEEKTKKTEQVVIENNIAFARSSLVIARYIDNKKMGYWELTAKAKKEIRNIFYRK